MKILIYSLLLTALVIFFTNSKVPPTIAAVGDCTVNTGPEPRVKDGLISSTGGISALFDSNTGSCITGNSAGFTATSLESFDYADLKSQYFTQSKLTSSEKKTDPAGSIPITESAIINYTTDRTVNGLGAAADDKVIVVFINGSLTISGDILYASGNNNGGLVFVVEKDIIINETVTDIHAVLISGGTIYTGVTSPATTCAKNSANNQLRIFGSLISLNATKPVVFCRTLNLNTQAAEKITYKSKYPVILSKYFSKPLIIITED